MKYLFLPILFPVALATIDPRIAEWKEAQERNDAEFANYTINPNILTESTPFGDFTLKTKLYASEYSVVYTIWENRDYLIKYQTNCERSNSLETLVRDFWFSNEVHKLERGPKPYFISPPVRLTKAQTEKFRFTMDQRHWRRCYTRGGTVRFMLIERIMGVSLQQYRRDHTPNGFDMLLAVSDLYAIVSMIQKLHENDIIHGDIHSGNVMVYHNETDGHAYLMLIDHGRAFFYDPNQSDDSVPEFNDCNSEIATPWQLRGLPWGKRDDIYRAMDVFARLVQPDEWKRHVRRLVELGDDAILDFRENEFFLDKPVGIASYGSSPFSKLRVSLEDAAAIRQGFVDIMDRILAMDHVNSEPPYDYILDELEKIKSLLDA